MNINVLERDRAQNLARLHGFKAFPVDPATKRPQFDDWPRRASSDGEVIEAWATEFPGAIFGTITPDGAYIAGRLFAKVKATQKETSGLPPPPPLEPYTFRDTADVPPREHLYAGHYFRKFLSLTVAPGGVGKSSLSTVEAAAMASGLPLVGRQPQRKMRVLYWNGDDDRDEVERRFHAVFRHFDLDWREAVGDRLILATSETLPIRLASMERGSVKEHLESSPTAGNARIYGQVDLTDLAIDAGVDVAILDPLKQLHRIAENDNGAMDAVANILREIAREADIAIDIVHHAVKAARVAGQADLLGEAQSRGASALLDAIRQSRQLTPMTEEEGRKVGAVTGWRDCFRIDGGKVNLTRRPDRADWFRKVGVRLDNFTEDYPEGDEVAAVERFVPVEAGDGLSEIDIEAALQAVAAGCWKESGQAQDWVGYPVGEALGIDIGPRTAGDRTAEQIEARSRVTRLISQWRKEKRLVSVTETDPRNRRPTQYIRRGPGVLSDLAA